MTNLLARMWVRDPDVSVDRVGIIWIECLIAFRKAFIIGAHPFKSPLVYAPDERPMQSAILCR